MSGGTGGFFDILRRGVDNAVANWPLIALRVAETVFLGIVAVASVVALLLPILVSIGIALDDLDDPDDLLTVVTALAGKWMILVWIGVAVTVLLLLFVAVHAFFEAGRARVLVAGERAAGPGTAGPRSRFAAFSGRAWLAGAAAGWWPLFWIYNAIWGLAGLVLLVPLLPTVVLMLLFRERPGLAVATGCLGLLFTLLLGLVTAILAGMWTIRATAQWGLGGRNARQAMAEAWRAILDDFWRHLLVALVVIVVGMAGSTVFASFSFLIGFSETFSDSFGASLAMLPVRFAGSVLSSILSAAVSTWYLASFAVLAVEGEGENRG